MHSGGEVGTVCSQVTLVGEIRSCRSLAGCRLFRVSHLSNYLVCPPILLAQGVSQLPTALPQPFSTTALGRSVGSEGAMLSVLWFD